MNIIIDVTRLFRRLLKRRILTGIDRVTMAYVHHYHPNAYALVRWSGRSWVLSPNQSQALFKWLINPGSTRTVLLILAKGIMAGAALKSQSDTFLLNTGHIGLKQADYQRLMHRLGVKPIFLVHDLIPIAYPEYCSAGEDNRHKEKMNHVLGIASAVITNSEATRQELLHYSQQTNQLMPKIEVALLAPGIKPVPPAKSPIDKPYFVMLSTIEPRKNHVLILQIWRQLFQQLGEQTPQLFVIGQRGWECENALDLLERSHLLKNVVTEVSHCSDVDLINYISHSRALLFPSFAEGYGLPLVEALALGTPVIASNLPVFHEIAGTIPEYIDPLDGKRWQELIIEYMQPMSLEREKQLKRMQAFKVPTWNEYFIKIDSFLDTLTEKHPHSEPLHRIERTLA